MRYGEFSTILDYDAHIVNPSKEKYVQCFTKSANIIFSFVPIFLKPFSNFWRNKRNSIFPPKKNQICVCGGHFYHSIDQKECFPYTFVLWVLNVVFSSWEYLNSRLTKISMEFIRSTVWATKRIIDAWKCHKTK